MLFVSPHPSYQLVGIVQEEPVYHPQTGKYLKTNPGIDAEFFHGGAPSWAIEEAMAHARFHEAWSGLPDDQPRHAMISSFDTDHQAQQNQWSPETKDFVEQFMLNHPDYGVRYIAVEPPYVKLEEPWRGYDATHHKKIKVIARELDVESQQYALEYEKANKNRPEVVADLAEIVGEEVVVTA